MIVTTTNETLSVSDDTQMNAFIAAPAGDKVYPGIIVLQEAYGVTSHIQDICKRLAENGYVAIAPEIFHRTITPGTTIAYGNMDEARPHIAAMTVEGQEADMKAAYEWLISKPTVDVKNIASIGFCMGGRLSYIANCVLPLQAAISYYAGGMTPFLSRASELHCRHLFFWGGKDKHIPHEAVESLVLALAAAKKDYINVEISFADHAFNCDDRPNYHPQAAKEAWALSMMFLEQQFAE